MRIVRCVLWSLLVAVLFVLLGCSVPRESVVREHHYREVDTLAVQAAVDGRLREVRELWVQDVTQRVSNWQSEQQSQEQQRERITETVTLWVDSLGRVMRQEQRTTERDMSRQEQLREERMEQLLQERMERALDSMDGVWCARMEEYRGHSVSADSTSVDEKPVPADNRPWYRRMWDAVKWMAVGAVVVGVLVLTRKLWGSWLRVIISKL